MDKLKTIINTVLTNIGLDAVEELRPEMDLRDDLQIDSISFAELIVHIDEEFGIDVNSDGQVNTVGDIQKQLENTN